MQNKAIRSKAVDLIKKIIAQDGPEKSDYSALHAEIERLGTFLQQPSINGKKYNELLDVLSPVLTTETMQGFAFQKPHGYPGDYEIMDRIYLEWKSENENLVKWDEFFHFQKAPMAVRNRKQCFLEMLASFSKKRKEVRVLNVGSGPGRDMLEFFQDNPDANVYFDCVDFDKDAIKYASRLCSSYLDRISFVNKNAFRFSPVRSYDVIWSAGLFDYLNDKQFVFLLRKLHLCLNPDGELFIGNFSIENPSRKYMELFGKWYLVHRSRQQLFGLATDAGIDSWNVQVFSEPLGVNLFLHVKNTEASTSLNGKSPALYCRI